MSSKRKIEAARWSAMCARGCYQMAAKEAASHYGEGGEDREGALSLARHASKNGSEQMLMLAFALWPDARGPGAEAFLAGLGTSASLFALRSDRALAHAAKSLWGRLTIEQAREELAQQRSKASQIKEEQRSKFKAEKKRLVVIVRKRIEMRSPVSRSRAD